jgi:hypothetical protein
VTILSTGRGAAAALVALACAGARRAGGAAGSEGGGTRRSFAVPGQGLLEVTLPAGWEAVDKPGDATSPRTIELGPPGRPFLALLSPVENPEASQGREGADTAQLLAELSRRRAAETAVESEIPLMELVGEAGVHGFWFAATDRSMEGKQPKPGEYRHLMQGAAAIGPILLAFTLLDNGPGPQRSQLLALVRTARLAAGAAPGGTGGPGEGGAGEGGPEPGGPGGGAAPGSRAADGFEPDPGAETVPLVVHDPAHRVSVLVDLPGFAMFKPRPSEDGTAIVVLGENPETGIVASVILREARGLDARGCRDDALARIRSATPGIVDVRTSEVDGVARASYALQELHGQEVRQQHAHAFLARNGVCANLHLSKADASPEDAARFEQILGSLRFGEAL